MGMTDINSVRREKDDEEAEDEERDQLQFSNGSSVSEIRRFEIAYDRPEALYFSGDSVTGEVQISLEDTIHVKGVVVRFVGEAYVNVPMDDEGSEGSNKGATWQKRCKNLRILASRRKRNKVYVESNAKPSGAGMSNHGFSSDSKGVKVIQKETPTPHANGGHKVKSEASDDEVPPEAKAEAPSEAEVPSEVASKEEVDAEGTEVVELDDGASERSAAQKTKALETVKEEEEDQSEQPVKEVRFSDEEGGKEEKKTEGGGEIKEDVAPAKGKEKQVPVSSRRSNHHQQGGADQGNRKRAAPKFRSLEKYFDYRFYVFGHKYSSAREHLSSGAHRFRFSYVLPGKLPSSFHGKYGYVRYFCEASLERAWAPSITRKAMFSVSASVDVNREPRAESGAGGHRSTHGCLFCCPRGTVMAEAGVRRRGFVPGEKIPLRAHILNVSDRRVRRTRARLLQVVTYHSNNGGRSKVDEVVVTEAVKGEVPRGEADTWGEESQGGGAEADKNITPSAVSLEVPPLPANFKCSEFCKIIDVDYRLDFMVEVEGELEPLHIRMPIVVGTVPLERVFRTMEMGPRRRSTSSAAEKAEGGTHIIVPGSSQYVEFPLPRFEPCTWGPRHVEAYFHQEVLRKLGEEDDTTGAEVGAAAKVAKTITSVAAAGAVPGVGSTLRVHRKGETFAPRYVCYRLKDPDAAGVKAARRSIGELSLSPLSPGLKIPPSEAWIPRDTSETELVSPGSGPSRDKRH